jgi:hypothetical protein
LRETAAEDGRVRADAQRQREDGRDRHARTAKERARSVAKVGQSGEGNTDLVIG